MGYTKGDLVQSALNEIGIADYDFDIAPEQTQSALQRLDSMMAQWDSEGLKLGYPIPSTALGSTLDQDSGVPDVSWEAIITNLAIRIAPSYGKVVLPDTKMTAKNGIDTLYSMFALAPEMQIPSMPKGAGYKTNNPFFSDPTDTLKDGDSAELDLQGVF